jgi:hypothetical protein
MVHSKGNGQIIEEVWGAVGQSWCCADEAAMEKLFKEVTIFSLSLPLTCSCPGLFKII